MQIVPTIQIMQSLKARLSLPPCSSSVLRNLVTIPKKNETHPMTNHNPQKAPHPAGLKDLTNMLPGFRDGCRKNAFSL